jgi:ATP synthase F1 delta subunit
MTKTFVLARKYATAFLEVYGNSMTLDNYHALQSFKRVWDAHPDWLRALTMPTITHEKKIMLCTQMLAAYQVMPDVIKLMTLLINDKRESHFSKVLDIFCSLYLQKTGIVECTLASSHPLDEHERTIIQQFIAHQVGYRIMYDYKVDPDLIAGIKVTSPTFMWEYSVARQLREIELSSRVRNY